MWSVSKIPVGLCDQRRWPLAGSGGACLSPTSMPPPPDHLADLDLSGRFPESPEILDDKLPTKFTDPCKQAALQSMRCLERYGHDKLMCHNEFYIYRQCKKEFTRQLRESRRA